MFVVIFSGFLFAALAPALYRGLNRGTGWLLALLPAGYFAYFLNQMCVIADGGTVTAAYPWVPSLGVSFSFYLDGLSLLFALIVSGIGALVVIYAGGYLAGNPFLGRFYAIILLFMTAMLGLVLAGNLLTLFVFWELTSITSYLLIGFKHQYEASRAAAWQALLVTGAGGLALMAGLVLLGQAGDSYELAVLLERGDAVRSSALYLPALLLILAGAFTKSAQFPFYFWLPGAMQAPAPVSAYLHSATMVKAGIYLLTRLSPVLGGTPEWQYLVTLFGVVTMAFGAVLSLTQVDLKRILAFSTVSTLGALTLLVGLDTTLSLKAAMVLLLVHSLYKGALFLAAGNIEHESDTRDIRLLGGLIRYMPVTTAAVGLAAFSMAGFPPLLGFISKELLYEAKLQAPQAGPFVLAVGVLANVFLVAVAGVLSVRPLFRRKFEAPRTPHEAPPVMWFGPFVLAGLGLAAGLFPEPLADCVIGPAVSAARAQPTEVKLALWHGLNPVLALSIATVLCGVGLYLVRRRVRRLAERLSFLAAYGPERGYDLALHGLIELARWQTRGLQSGYLRMYLLTILATTVGLSLYTLLTRIDLAAFAAGLVTSLSSGETVYLHEVAVALVIMAGILAAVRSRSRLAAVAALGVVGYGMALLYIFFGAPDLAMTQFTIETLTVILLVLVLYRLPKFARLSGQTARIRDTVVALLAGGLMAALVLVVTSVPLRSALSPFFIENSVALAKGRNIVNVILVDFRGIDTMGEITVLGVAAIGVYALLRLKLSGEE